MTKPRVLITRRWPEAAQKAVAEAFDVTLNETDVAMTPQQLAEALRSFDAVAWTLMSLTWCRPSPICWASAIIGCRCWCTEKMVTPYNFF